MCAECSTLRNERALIADELAQTMDMYEIEAGNRRRAEREVLRLKRELNGSTSKESQRVKEVCEYHATLWKALFPRAKGLSYPNDGKNATAVRRALRWGLKVEEIKRTLDGAFASDFHKAKPTYLYLSSVLGDENKIRNHLVRSDEKNAQALMDEGLRLVKDTLHPVIEAPLDRFLKALEAKGIEWRASRWGDEGFSAFLWFASCPSCDGVLRVTENVAGGVLPDCRQCNLVEILEPLWLVPSDLWTGAPVELELAA